MAGEIKSFQENIRKTFIWYSLTPVIVIVITAFIIFIAAWGISLRESTRDDNEGITKRIENVMNDYYSMVDDVSEVMVDSDSNNKKDAIFSAMYGATSDYDELGEMVILDGANNQIFSSSDGTYPFLTKRGMTNWGVWKLAKNNPNQTRTILFEGKLFVVRSVYENDKLQYGIFYIVPPEVIRNQFKGEDKTVFITDNLGWVYLYNNKVLMDDLGRVEPQLENTYGYTTIDGHIFYSYRNDSDMGISVYTISDIHRSIRTVETILVIIIVIFIGIILISYRNADNSSKEYTRDVKKIEQAFESVQQGDLDVSLDIDSSKEFQTIGRDFNQMLEGLKEEIAQNQELAENAAFSQVKQLESQFNPHFLFNTLDNIRFMAKIDAKAADKMIVSLSGLLRYSIRETRDEVTVREDLHNLQLYLNILQIRFNKRFSYSIDVSEEIYDCLIPKLVIQPLIENAIKYGFEGRETLDVKIRGTQHQDNIVFVCEDDGAGMDESLLAELKQQLEGEKNESSHLGLYNIHRRIQLMYKGDYGLNIESVKDRGTTVRVTIPKHR